ncbi:hypothetical protein ABZZ80_45380, partial [Streptomyces sp. NPDC006356]
MQAAAVVDAECTGAADADLEPAGSKAPAAPTAEAMNSDLLDIPDMPDIPRMARLLSLTPSSGLRLMEIRTGSEADPKWP